MKKRFNKRDIAMDLTSLLDVIFIVLLVVMCNQKFNTESAKDVISEAQRVYDESSKIVEEYEQHMDKYENTEEYVLFVDVTANFDPDSVTERTISVFVGASDEGRGQFEQEITPKNETAVYEALEQYLESVVDSYMLGDLETVRPIIFTVNKGDSNILYRDELAIETVFENLKNKDKYKERNFIYVR